MAMMMKILKSDNAEVETRQVERLKKEIEFLTIDVELREMKIQKLRNKP